MTVRTSLQDPSRGTCVSPVIFLFLKDFSLESFFSSHFANLTISANIIYGPNITFANTKKGIEKCELFSRGGFLVGYHNEDKLLTSRLN